MPEILSPLQEGFFLFHMHPGLQAAYPDTEVTDARAVHGYPKGMQQRASSDLQYLSLH